MHCMSPTPCTKLPFCLRCRRRCTSSQTTSSSFKTCQRWDLRARWLNSSRRRTVGLGLGAVLACLGLGLGAVLA
eukprot:100276-Chlamydomonas_euryale.AAC.1